ncbi:bacteriocin immunity protein [Peptostreptococcus russellii]|uniref:bacteriocin immunity protein n=1 Tax=Peptostreptococcus russellii TaxID=215200 RepID=UPI0026F2064E|nr:bacteriocin immunity protein [Peptostreptococcus russellii]
MKNKKEFEEEFLSKVYNLILNENTLSDERVILVEFKNNISIDGKNFNKEVEILSEKIRVLAIKKYNQKECLSKEVGKLYNYISEKGLFKRELGCGIASIGIWM